MEDFKNIITLLNNPETLELGVILAVAAGAGEKIVSLYETKASRQNYKRRSFFNKNKGFDKERFFLKKSMAKRRKDKHFSQTRNSFSDVIFNINTALFIQSQNKFNSLNA